MQVNMMHLRAHFVVHLGGPQKELTQFLGDLRLGGIGHGRVGAIPVADNAHALKLGALYVDPFVGEFAAFLAEFNDWDLILVFLLLAVLFLDLPFDGQTVAIPPRHVISVLSEHLLAAVDDVLENLIECVTDVQMPVGVGWSVMEDELLAALRRFADPAVEVRFLPAGEDFWLAFRKAGLHGKIRARQVDG